MIFMICYVVLCFVICIVLMCGMMLGYNIKSKDVKSSPFECGFDSSGVVRLPFCMKFFLVGIIFLVFDIEVTLLFPVYYSTVTMAPLLLVLLGGLYYEWGYGGLQWMV